MKILLAAFLSFVFLINANAQDPEFSQFYANQLYLNPAFAGTKICPRISFNYRNQWNGQQGGISTSSFSYDQYSNALKGGIGMVAMRDNVTNSLLVNNQFSLIYAYHLKLSRKYTLNFGMQASIVNKSIDLSRFQFGDQLSFNQLSLGATSESMLNDSKTYADFSAGLLFYGDNLFAGLSVFHVTQPDESFFENNVNQLPLRLSLHGGYKFRFNEKNKYRQTSTLTTSMLVRHQRVSLTNSQFVKSDFTHYLIGVYYSVGIFSLGTWYRFGDAFITTLGVEYKDVKFGYSFDYTTSRYGMSNGGAHEISLQFMLPCTMKKKKLRAISCPSF